MPLKKIFERKEEILLHVTLMAPENTENELWMNCLGISIVSV